MTAALGFVTRRCLSGQHGLCRGARAGELCGCRCGHPAWLNARTAGNIAELHEGDPAAALHLMDILGLIDGPDGREILPDEGNVIDLEVLRLCPGEPGPDDDEPPRPIGPQPKPSFVPEGLWNPPSPAALPARRPAALRPIEHGTEVGYLQHHQRGALPVCADCQLAHDMEAPPIQEELTEEEPVTAPVVEDSTSAPEPDASPTLPAEPRRCGGCGAELPPRPPGQGGRPRLYCGRKCKDLAHDQRAGVTAPRPADAPVELPAPPPPPPVPAAVDLDVWFTAAQQSPSSRVRRAAVAASSALLQLNQALDELARAERLAGAAVAGGDG